MKSTRRTFLATASAAAGTLAVARRASAMSDGPIKIGVIGVGGYGMADARAAIKVGGVEIVAVCDVDSEHLMGAAIDTLYPEPPPPDRVRSKRRRFLQGSSAHLDEYCKRRHAIDFGIPTSQC